MKTFYILDTFSLPTAYNHRFFVEKFAKGFSYNGYKVKIINSIKQLREPGFVMVSDHNFYYSLGMRNNINGTLLWYFPALLEKIDKFKLLITVNEKIQKNALRKLAAQIKNKNIILIAWYRNQQQNFIDLLNIPTIYTGEYFYSKPYDKKHLDWYNFYKSKKNALPIEFAADIDPKKVGKNCKNKKFKVSYVGNRSYNQSMYKEFEDMDDCSINPSPPYISEKKRIHIYKNSMVSLGFHAKLNIKNAIVNERVFESLAYGAICVSDNRYAPLATDNCAIFTKNLEELKKRVKSYNNNKYLRKKIRQKGFEMIKKRGTYMVQAKNFITLAKHLF